MGNKSTNEPQNIDNQIKPNILSCKVANCNPQDEIRSANIGNEKQQNKCCCKCLQQCQKCDIVNQQGSQKRNSSILEKAIMFSEIVSYHQSNFDKQSDSREQYFNIVMDSDERLAVKDNMDGNQTKNPEYQSKYSASNSPQIHSVIQNQPQQIYIQSQIDQIAQKQDEQPYQIILRNNNRSIIINNQQITSNRSIFNQNHDKQIFGGEQVRVPFKVVKLSLNLKMYEEIKRYQPQLIKLWESQGKEKYQHWKILRNGLYFSEHKGFGQPGIFVNNKFYYQGGYVYTQKKSSYLNPTGSQLTISKYIPDGEGLYICEGFTYKGSIKEGKADGVGKLQYKKTVKNAIKNHRNTSSSVSLGKFIQENNSQAQMIFYQFEGNWQQAQPFEGTLKAWKQVSQYKLQLFKYVGCFRKFCFHGQGNLVIYSQNQENDILSQARQIKTKYVGHFSCGQYKDSESARYQCQEFKYIGAFNNGKKNGQGTLFLKKINKKFQGIWKNDFIMNPNITEWEKNDQT